MDFFEDKERMMSVMRWLAFIMAIFAVMKTFVMSPQFDLTTGDLIKFKFAALIGNLVSYGLPGALTVDIFKIRDKVPLFRKRKAGFTILAWAICISAGIVIANLIGCLILSDEYMNSLEKYYKTISLMVYSA